MTFLKVVLTSNNIQYCKRAYDSLGDDTVIICNTLDDSYYEELKSFFGDSVIRTVSNGMPGQGKQSVIDYFLTTEYDYLVPVDGDDFVYPESLDIIKDTVEKYEPDVIGLTGEDRKFIKNDPFEFLVNSNISKTQMQHEFQEAVKHIEQNDYVFNRLICINKKAARLIEYNINLIGCEDIRVSCDLKLKHIENIIKYIILESPDVYFYDRSLDDSASKKLFEWDPKQFKKLFHEGLTDSDLLVKTELPYIKAKEKNSKMKRYRYATKIIRQYNQT